MIGIIKTTKMNEMPKVCDDCAFCIQDRSARCGIENVTVKNNEKPVWCPLIEVNNK